ncbi:leucine-rich repeat and calponin homology domain-containing protein 1-like isoform X4 [Asterias amurensis]|uniref:leucine-rich repeat and calponin homology domain-containing protein 1-like isoform X4 n=1 Tax=Asterias amurensis TaxID=7602 RepID=UPI003AB7BE9D
MAIPTSHHLGGAQLRSLEKVLEDAHMTGILNLGGRNMRDFPKSVDKFDLMDTLDVDISKNRFTEVPDEVCEYLSLERLNCYNNAIRIVPESFSRLLMLTYLNLSRNSLSALPIEICEIYLEVLIVSNNKLVALPPAVGKMKTLMHLDASCNELDTLPMQIGDMVSMKELNLRRNHLVHLPEEISRLNLVMLDVSCNKISFIPPSYRHIHSLEILKLDHNPLDMPPAQVCTRGKVHIFKYLSNIATKDEKRRGQEQNERLSRQSLNNANSVVEDFAFWNAKIGELRRGTLTADSGYVDGDKRWSATEPSNDDEEARILAERANQQKEHRQQREELLNQSFGSFSGDNEGDIDYIDTGEDVMEDGEITPTQKEPDEFTKALTRQKAIYEDQKLKAREERIRHEQEERRRKLEEEERWKAERRREAEQERYRRSSPSGSTTSLQYNGSNSSRGIERRNKPRPLSSSSFNESLRRPTSLEISQTKRPARRATVNVSDPYTRPTSNHSSTLPNGRLPSVDDSHRQLQRTENITSVSSSSLPSSQPPPPPSQPDSGISQSRHEAQLARRRQEEEKARMKLMQKSALRNFVQSRTPPSPQNSSTPEDQDPQREASPGNAKSPPPPVSYSGSAFGSIKPRSAFSIGGGKPKGEVQPNFTVKREMNKYREEMDRIEHLRKCIETRLKVNLPDDIPAALEDGVVLCHFMNNVFPHAVPTIHVPSPAVPKLTSAKCRRNVENFLKACSTAGVTEEKLCTAGDILEGKGLVKVASTVQALLTNTTQPKMSSAV